MDIGETERPRCVGPQNTHFRVRYAEIGRVLLICEASCYSAGIPWLPPIKEVRQRIRLFDPPLTDFVRISLLGIETPTLECYLSDLAATDQEDSAALDIPPPSPLARYSLSVVLFGILFSANCLLYRALGYNVAESLFGSFSLGLVGAAIGIVAASEVLRRRSFYLLIEKEILRRRGAGIDGATPIATPIESEPVPE